MKNIDGLIVVIIALLIGFMFFRGCDNKKGVYVTQAFLDSLIAVANTPPDTVQLPPDTVWPDPVVKWKVKEIPVPIAVNTETNVYHDSLVNNELAIYINDTIRENRIFHRDIGYKLFVPKKITDMKIVTQKVPVPIQVPGKKYFAGVGLGGNFAGGLAGSVQAGIVKNNKRYSAQIVRFNSNNFLIFNATIDF